MFCNQCEQTKAGRGCTAFGICGKDGQVAALQDLLIYAVQGIAWYVDQERKQGIVDHDIDELALEAIFATLTNVDFDPARFDALVRRAVEVREVLGAKSVQ